ncbi:hypothetical protein CO038_02735 [Candidatus Pacearchaeota archaeon CG_4_9_14_0_2_um_filter_39_13]|nr:hypothetical protein [Candidatus Pacearchaeota archaeon]OIO43093.1 MAG: hypothetical protein AUJ64_02830 [Candidatus Pacearchaeota archaeon CG1_02_39_14]PJC44633.1 MAG: hypothetical protein CO038_02735 [Candidatus Pacearchaeota archaeon CG_4_9_14_0_2_um_filter_39_13]
MRINFIKSGEKKKLLKDLNETFGIKEIKHVLLETGKGKVRGFTGSMNREELEELAEIARVETIGLYLFRKEDRGELRLGLDGCHAFGEQIDKNVIEIEDVEKWMKGEDLIVEEDYGMKVVANNGDLLGCGKSTGEKLVNFVPKERRIRRS